MLAPPTNATVMPAPSTNGTVLSVPVPSMTMERTATPCGARRPSPLRAGSLAVTLSVLLLVPACGGDPSAGEAGDADPLAAGGAAAPGPDPATLVGAPSGLELETVDAGVQELLIGISPVSEEVAWFSGTDGRWLRTLDGGATWSVGRVAGHEALQFRDVHAFDGETAVLLAAGDGADSRIFRTEDGGASWSQSWVMDHPEGFLDCMDFWDDDRGLAYGDAVDGGLYVLETRDGGRSWSRLDPATLPDPAGSEGGFAASGTCLTTPDPGEAFIATGNGDEPRVLSTRDWGESWAATPVPLASGASRGGTSVGFSEAGLGFVVGGTIGATGDSVGAAVALSADRARSWSPGGEPAMDSPLYGAAWIPGSYTLVAAGPGGLDWSTDGGLTWASLSPENHWSVAFASPRVGWAGGPGGRITRIRVVE